MIDKVEGKRIGNDINKYLIMFWRAIQNGFIPPEHITKKEYYKIKENKEEDWVMTLWVGICCSYGGKWFWRICLELLKFTSPIKQEVEFTFR